MKVVAVRNYNDEEINIYGYGNYLGFKKCSALNGISNPLIRLDNGKEIWGYQCWWCDKDTFKEISKNKKINIVSLKSKIKDDKINIEDIKSLNKILDYLIDKQKNKLDNKLDIDNITITYDGRYKNINDKKEISFFSITRRT